MNKSLTFPFLLSLFPDPEDERSSLTISQSGNVKKEGKGKRKRKT
jgi:hypothetical protein